MPYVTRKVRGKPCYKVVNTKKRKVFSKCTSHKNAMKQMRLLRALQYNKTFMPYSQKGRNRTMKKR